MEKQRLNFFLTCPFCKKKFGVTPETVLKYLHRVFDDIDQELNKVEEKVRKRES